MATSASIDKVQKLFIAFYQRPADVTGLEYWANRVDAANGDTSAVVNAFATSAEATALYPATLSTTQLVNNVYQALFGRAPDAAGLNFYANAIAAGTMTPGKLAQNILDGATGTDATIIANKLTVAKAYTAAMDTTAEILAYNGNNGNNALANAKLLLTGVDASNASVTTATGQIPALMTSNVANAVFTPATATMQTGTEGIDTITLSAVGNWVSALGGNDTVNAAGTLTGTLDGGAGTDTLALTAASNISAATISNFESITLAGATTMTLAQNNNNMYTITGAQAVTLTDAGTVTDRGAANVSGYTLASGANTFNAAAGSTSVTAAAGTTSATFNFGATLDAGDVITGNATGTTDKLVLTGAGTGSAGVTNIEQVVINNTSGAAVTVTTGAMAPGAASTINMSGSTAAVTLNATAYVATTSLGITDGAGNDTITVSNVDAQRLLTTVNLVTGGNDTVVINNAVVGNQADSHVTITNFGSTDIITTQIGGTGSSSGIFTNDYTGAAALAVATHAVIEVNASNFQLGTLSNAAAVLAWLTAAGVTSTPAGGDATVIVYNGSGTAGIYQVLENTGAASAFDVIELVGTVNAANNSLVGANFA